MNRQNADFKLLDSYFRQKIKKAEFRNYKKLGETRKAFE